ncbi:MAG: hypothetical protein GVX78_05510 [Bacteroidetes bacterium]|jgi:hypothetical protein|nr:hypothetical protein [Bacteroidota bacterium]
MTFGDFDHNITFGGGAVFTNDSMDDHFWVFNITAMDRMSQKVSVISNNFLGVLEKGFIEFFSIQGMRIMSKSVAIDIGLIFNADFLSEGTILPYVGYIQRL